MSHLFEVESKNKSGVVTIRSLRRVKFGDGGRDIVTIDIGCKEGSKTPWIRYNRNKGKSHKGCELKGAKWYASFQRFYLEQFTEDMIDTEVELGPTVKIKKRADAADVVPVVTKIRKDELVPELTIQEEPVAEVELMEEFDDGIMEVDDIGM